MELSSSYTLHAERYTQYDVADTGVKLNLRVVGVSIATRLEMLNTHILKHERARLNFVNRYKSHAAWRLR